MNLLQNMSIRSKLILVALLPVSGLLFYLQENIRSELADKEAVQQVVIDVSEIDKISNVIYELQKEWMSIVAVSELNVDGNTFRQRESTNKAVLELNNTLTQYGRRLENAWLLDSLSAIRTRLDAGKFTDADNDLYLEGKALLLEEINKIIRSTRDLDLKSRLEDHLFLIYTKDYLGQLRRMLGRALISKGKEFDIIKYGRFLSVYARYELNLGKLRTLASPELRAFLDGKYRGTAVQQTAAMIAAASEGPHLRNFAYTFEDWYAGSTTNIGLLGEAEDFSGGLIRTKAEAAMTAATGNVLRTSMIAAAVIILIIFFIAVTIKGIVTSLARIKTAADRMAKGEVDIELTVSSRDEIGDLAATFNRMIVVTKDFSLGADAIGQGDYSTAIAVRSEADMLGKALETMRKNLRKLSVENETRTWFLTGNGELNDTMRGEKDVITLSQEVISKLTEYLKAQIGAIYIRENGHLNLAGSYAFSHRKDNANAIAMGQGFVGQSALEKKAIVYSDIPDDYIRINSGLGSSAPKNIIVFPFVYEGEVKGVIEIGSSRTFSELDTQFLQMVSDNIAIAFNGSQSRDRMRQLLEETQRQAEELETQQEELKQSNEELREKTELLEKSEAELKAQQEELQQTNEELEEKANLLEDQKQGLENARMQVENKARELEATSKYKSEFLANMSHELRTPLNSILILSQILIENKSNTLGEKETQFATNIYNAGTDLLNLINEILDLAKVEAGKMELDVTEFSIDQVAENIRGMFSEVAAKKSIRFDIDTGHLDRQVFSSDRQRLEQILRNLLSNAFKFTEAGGNIKLSIARVDHTVAFRKTGMAHVKEVIAFSVADTGIGIPRDKWDVIFEAFQQVDGSTKRKYGGTGLGLSISRELAGTLGGEIHVSSEEDKGSVFTLYLPANFDPAMLDPEVPRRIAVKESVPGEKQKEYSRTVEKVLAMDENAIDDRNDIMEKDRVVLIMEDDADFAGVLLAFVRERAYKGIVAYRGNTGLSYARYYRPDAIILDMKLPVMDGAEVLRHLKSDPDLRHIPVQIISGFDRRKEGLELGAFDFIQKPVTQEVLWRAFDKIEDFASRKLKRILIVEDDKRHSEAVKELIGNGDVKCFSAYSGHEAHTMLKADPFDCIIVDIGLPDMTGFDFLEKIKDDRDLLKMPVIVYTGKDLTKEENKRLDKLANTVVLKTAYSHERLLDETMLFLHRVESRLPKEKQQMIRRLHKTDEVLKGKKVLVVDDDIRNVYSITNALEEEGLHCITAENGNEALRALAQHPQIDIVLMDVMMPEMDGYEATREIRKIEKYGKLPIVALTAKAMKGDREKCLAAGMSDYVSKPLNIEQLLSLMRVWLYK